MSDEFVPHADWPFPKTAEDLEKNILRDEIERLTKELFAAKSTRLPQRKPLTDEEIRKLKYLHDYTAGWSLESFARAIEQAHKIGVSDEQ